MKRFGALSAAQLFRPAFPAVLSAVILVGTPPHIFGQKPVKTTLCAIIKNSKRFDRLLVEFPARYTVGFEHTILEDQECEKGITPRFPHRLVEEEKLRNACKDSPGTAAKVNTATWVGVFKYHPKSVPAWTLDVRQIREFTFSCELFPFWGGLVPNESIRLPEPPAPTWPPSR